MVQNNKVSLKYFGAFIDFFLNICVISASFIVAERWLNYIINEQSIVLGALLTVFASAIYFIFDLYSAKRWEKLMPQIVKLVLAQVFVMGVSVTVVWLVVPKAENFILTIVICIASLVFLCIKKIIATKALHYLRIKNKNPKYVLIVGNGYGAVEYARQINDNLHFGYRIIGCVSDEEKPRFKKLGNYSELESVIKEHHPHEVILSLEAREDSKTQKILSICDRNGVRASIIPVVYKYFKAKCQVDMVGNLPLINTRAIPLDNIANAAIKRAIDIIGSIILIILTSPLMIIAAIGVRLSSKGPIIFKQVRVGKDNKEFTIYKFRSMRMPTSEHHHHDEEHQTEADDDRKTRFGTFMRKTGIDELPQFFNVLFGSMSLVGPRPELPVFVEEYSKTIPLYMVKHQVKPGITGLAQIYGFRGETSIERRIELDLKYIENWTLYNDLKIILKTPFKILNRNEKYKKKK